MTTPARVVDVIRRAAQAGHRAPTNQALREHFGWASTGSVAHVLRQAEAAELIRIERGQSSRVIEAGDGSWRTAGGVGAPHWRDRRAAAVAR
jgi:hypothetical protein